jgi:hypothetical protein
MSKLMQKDQIVGMIVHESAGTRAELVRAYTALNQRND